MQVIGFNFTKLSAERPKEFKPGSISTNVEFMDVVEEKVALLNSDAIKILFSYSIASSKTEKEEKKPGEITINGEIILTVTKDEEKEITKSWKKKEIPNQIKIPLLNLVLKKCTPKSAYLADEVSLPSPIPYPKITPEKKQ